MSTRAWNAWYHCMGNTYGTWLPGDPRGFRTRHHREHIEGDYRNPPPKGKYEKRFQRSKDLMPRDPMYLTWEQRTRAVDEFVKSLQKWKIDLTAISIDRVHMHVLARFPNHNPRHYLGRAKKESSAYMKLSGLVPTGGVWAIKTECKPINDCNHYDRVVQYILDHQKKGAAAWRAPATSNDFNFDPDCLLLENAPISAELENHLMNVLNLPAKEVTSSD